MLKTITNEKLSVTINSLGAELASIKTADGTERLWNRNPDVWPWQAPILFPWTGRITDQIFTYEGKEYNGKLHGCLRDYEHELVSETSDNTSVTFAYKFTDTENVFPFEFYAEQTFLLEGETLHHSVRIKNTGNKTMPFGLGYHPAFTCPFSADKRTSDYEIVFDSAQTIDLVEMIGEGYPNGNTMPFLINEDKIAVTDDMFVNGALPLTKLTSKTLTLQEKGSNRKVEVDIEGYPYVLLWSFKTETIQFVCIEPWHTLPDYIDADKEWTKKKNLLQLKAGETFNSRMSTTIS